METYKVGDKVLISSRMGNNFIDTILSITKAGNYKTKSGVYDKSGRLRGSGSWNVSLIVRVATEEDYKAIIHRNLKKKVREFVDSKEFDAVPYNFLTLAYSLLTKHFELSLISEEGKATVTFKKETNAT